MNGILFEIWYNAQFNLCSKEIQREQRVTESTQSKRACDSNCQYQAIHGDPVLHKAYLATLWIFLLNTLSYPTPCTLFD